MNVTEAADLLTVLLMYFTFLVKESKNAFVNVIFTLLGKLSSDCGDFLSQATINGSQHQGEDHSLLLHYVTCSQKLLHQLDDYNSN